MENEGPLNNKFQFFSKGFWYPKYHSRSTAGYWAIPMENQRPKVALGYVAPCMSIPTQHPPRIRIVLKLYRTKGTVFMIPNLRIRNNNIHLGPPWEMISNIEPVFGSTRAK